jgi:haloacetate dehalogenase
MPSSTTAVAPPFYPGFAHLNVEAGGVHFAGVVGGEGPPLLLLHGYPETHITWRKIAPALALNHTVIIPDLPGYGGSRIHESFPRWTKRRVADALVRLMEALGHTCFAVAGHDRGARAGYRLALDYPSRVTAFASLTVVPTLDALELIDYRAANQAFHWFFFAQEGDLPERMLSFEPDEFINRTLDKMTGGRNFIEPSARDAYCEAFRDASVRHAICEDYRAAMNEDLAYDKSDQAVGNKIQCPVLVLWPEEEPLQGGINPVGIWSRWAIDVTGSAIRGGHLQPEDAPEEVLAMLELFFINR